MEFLPLIYKIAQYYAFFCLVTALCFVYLNLKAFWIVKLEFMVIPLLSFLMTTFTMAFIFAPAFFFVFLFFSEVYLASVILGLTESTEEDSES